MVIHLLELVKTESISDHFSVCDFWHLSKDNFFIWHEGCFYDEKNVCEGRDVLFVKYQFIENFLDIFELVNLSVQ